MALIKLQLFQSQVLVAQGTLALAKVGGSEEILNREYHFYILRKLNVQDRQVVFG